MENNHRPSVNEMFRILSNYTNKLKCNFNFLDLGCGNGWVVREIIKNKKCTYAAGIDGSINMINKAKIFNRGDFIEADIETFIFKNKFDVIFSMETFYYFNDLKNIMTNIYINGLKNDGVLIIGLDHYLENKSTLEWDMKYNLKLNTLSINNWVDQFKISGFQQIIHEQYGSNKDWKGTLIIAGRKK